MISKAEAIKIANTYLELPINQIGDIKIPIYNSLTKRIKIRLYKFYGWFRNRYYIMDQVVEPDEWLIKSDKLVILDNGVYEGEFCWLVSYNSGIYNKSKNIMDLRLGPGPLIIDKYSGLIYETGSGDDNFIEEFNKFKKSNSSFMDWKAREIKLQ